jgi:hypothetical protein
LKGEGKTGHIFVQKGTDFVSRPDYYKLWKKTGRGVIWVEKRCHRQSWHICRGAGPHKKVTGRNGGNIDADLNIWT